MHRIELEMLTAMESPQDMRWKNSSTEVHTHYKHGRRICDIFLYGVQIAQVEYGHPVRAHLIASGTPSRTVASRLNAIVSRLLPGAARVNLKEDKMFLSLRNGSSWTKFWLRQGIATIKIGEDGVVTVS